jgi:hypothetical protein
MKMPDHLVLVAGHAVYVAPDYARPAADDSWRLQDFQRGEPPFYLEHIRRGAELAARDAGALLVFSGGQTRREAGPRSEAESYLKLAEHFGWLDDGLQARTATEEFARDSLENVLFGVCRFREVAGRWPARLTAVSWAFKEERFRLHCAALRWPAERFNFVGANNPRDMAGAQAGENKALEQFRRDPYGALAPLSDKRTARNPFHREPPYAQTCREIAGLLAHRGPEIYDGPLPWD